MSDQVTQLIEDVTAVMAGSDDPAVIIEKVAPLMAAMAGDASWLRPEFLDYDEGQGMGITVLNDATDGGPFLETVSWAPGGGVAPHDHQTWGVVVGLSGQEINVMWRRLDDGSREGYAKLEKASEETVTNGDVCTFLPDDIHGVRNDGNETSLSLHIYGCDTRTTNRSEFDPINSTQRPCPKRVRHGDA